VKKLRFLFFKNIKLYTRKILKKENNRVNEKIRIFISLSNNGFKLSIGLKPPEDIIVKEKLYASKFLKLINFKNINIINVRKIYILKILKACFKNSLESNEIKLVKDFFKFSSNISIR
tara:strand:- start:405 stop:758 length:354 start_codon:yes stop_codon:yes gene_type:complete